MIKKPCELTQTKQHYNVLIAGFPGIGKSTLGFSAPKPLMLNLDKGVMRVEARFRKDISEVDTYEELLLDLDSSDLSEYESIVVDTGGRLLELMKPWAKRKDAKNGQADGSLTLRGYGVVGNEFMRFLNHIKYDLKKHCIVLFHAKEEKDGDITKLRILVEGQTKENVWQPMDLGGFMEIKDKTRVIHFANTERFFGKGAFGVKGTYKIPELEKNSENNFIAMLFEKMDKFIAAESEEANIEHEKYLEVVNRIAPSIDCMTADHIEDVQNLIKNASHFSTSEKELKARFSQKLKELGYFWNKDVKQYQKLEL